MGIIVSTWQSSKVLFLCEAIGSILGIFSSSVLGFSADSPNMLLVLIPWLISAILLSYAAYLRKSFWVMILMTYYGITNIIGIVKVMS